MQNYNKPEHYLKNNSTNIVTTQMHAI